MADTPVVREILPEDSLPGANSRSRSITTLADEWTYVWLVGGVGGLVLAQRISRRLQNKRRKTATGLEEWLAENEAANSFEEDHDTLFDSDARWNSESNDDAIGLLFGDGKDDLEDCVIRELPVPAAEPPHESPRSLAITSHNSYKKRRIMSTLSNKLLLLGCLVFSGFCFWKAAARVFDDATSAINPPAQASETETSSPTSNQSATARRLVTTPIQDLRVGMRVVGRNPLAEDADRDLPEPDPKTWRLLRVRMEHKPSEFVLAEFLRPLVWIDETGATANSKIWLELAEMQAAGWANVIAIEPCPPIEPGDNPIITGTFQHVADKLAEVWVDGSNQPIVCTAKHPFWSNTQKAFVSADELQPGEKVVSAFGIDTTVKQIRHRKDRQTVYGLEVFGEHVYQVGQLGLLAHNASQKAKRKKKQTETIVRRMSKEEADVTLAEQGLVPKPGSKSAKWVTADKPQATLRKKGHEVTVEFEVEAGTKSWLAKDAIDFYEFGGGEAGLPNGVFTKTNEPGAYGIGVNKLVEFNNRVQKAKIK